MKYHLSTSWKPFHGCSDFTEPFLFLNNSLLILYHIFIFHSFFLIFISKRAKTKLKRAKNPLHTPHSTMSCTSTWTTWWLLALVFTCLWLMLKRDNLASVYWRHSIRVPPLNGENLWKIFGRFPLLSDKRYYLSARIYYHQYSIQQT